MSSLRSLRAGLSKSYQQLNTDIEFDPSPSPDLSKSRKHLQSKTTSKYSKSNKNAKCKFTLNNNNKNNSKYCSYRDLKIENNGANPDFWREFDAGDDENGGNIAIEDPADYYENSIKKNSKKSAAFRSSHGSLKNKENAGGIKGGFKNKFGGKIKSAASIARAKVRTPRNIKTYGGSITVLNDHGGFTREIDLG